MGIFIICNFVNYLSPASPVSTTSLTLSSVSVRTVIQQTIHLPYILEMVSPISKRFFFSGVILYNLNPSLSKPTKMKTFSTIQPPQHFPFTGFYSSTNNRSSFFFFLVTLFPIFNIHAPP